jgi:outer membrane receptor protein involved in Fe transport
MEAPLRFSAVAICFAAVAFAQGTGTIYGSVTDPSGAVVVGATLDATLTERGITRTVKSEANGQYVFSVMPIGTYEIRVVATGFQQFHRQSVSLDANQNLRVDVVLTVGSTSQSMTVTAEAPAVDSRSAILGTLIDDRRLVDMPTNGRNIYSLAALLPGASQVSAPQTFTGDRSGPTLSLSGTQNSFNLFLFDGQRYDAGHRDTGLNYPPPDALQEVQVLTSSYNAEYGHNAGSVFNVVTKSGSNQLHGVLWEFLRNSDLNARNFFAASNPQLAQNQFGAGVGGPIRKDKLFVFASYEGLRVRQGALATGAFPLTAAERTGDFSGAKPVNDPLTGSPFPNNQIPASRFDPVAQKVLSEGLMPLPNAAGGSLIQTLAEPQNNDQGLIRLDYNLSSKHIITGRYYHNYAVGISYAGQVPTYESISAVARVQSATVSDTYTITPSLVNEFRLSYNRFTPSYYPLEAFSLSDLGGNFPVLNGVKLPPSIALSSRVTLGASSSVYAQIVNEDYQLNDTLSWIKGHHSIKAGFEAFRRRYINHTYKSMGTFNFTGSITSNAAADFLLGKPATANVLVPELLGDSAQVSFAGFVQDDWRVNSRLTLNFGLRYELPLPWVEPNNYWATFYPGQQSTVFPNAPLGLVFYGDKGVPRGMMQTDYHSFAPRAGFAWDVFGDGRTAVRGGFGIYYNLLPNDIVQNASQPFIYTFTYNTPYSLSDPLRGQPPVPLTVNMHNPTFLGTETLDDYSNPSMRTPYVEQYNISIQHRIIGDTVLEAAYVGKLGHKLPQGVEANPAVYASGETLSTEDKYRIIPGWGDMIDIETSNHSSYHALQVQGRKRLSHHFSVQGTYTFSKAIDLYDSNAFDTAFAPQPFNLALERGLAGFNATHIGSLSWIVDLPSLKGQRAPLRLIAGGWQWNGLFTANTGMPLDPVVGSDAALSGTPNQRPKVVGDWHEPSGRGLTAEIADWFNPAAFAAPATGTFGNAGRNIIISPGSANANVALFKNVALPFREGLKLQFRSEFFNVLNRVNLGSPKVTLGGSMGRITSAGDARILQFAVKLLF